MSSIWMTEGEICTSFRQAKDQKKQIGILADLNACTGKVIKEILHKNGLFPLQRAKAAIEPEKERKKQMNGRKWTLEEVEFMLAKKKAGVPLGEIAADLGRTETAVNGKLQKLREEGMKIAEELKEKEADRTEPAKPAKSKPVASDAHVSVAEKLLAGYKSLMALSGLEEEIIIEIKRDRVKLYASCDGCVVTITFEGESA